MKNKKILLVGGCGFIGHNLALNFKKLGAEPIIVDSLSVNNLYSLTGDEIKNKKLYTSILNNRIELLKSDEIKLIIQDVRDYHRICQIYSEIDPDVIIHLAGEPVVGIWTKQKKNEIYDSRLESTTTMSNN